MTIKPRVFLFVLALWELGTANLAIADVVSALDREWAVLATITGFHDVTRPNSVFRVRVIEANGSATVGVNSIILYFVATNDSSAGDLQQHVWRLPFTVAGVESVTCIDSGVRVVSMLDAMPDTGVKARKLQLSIHYALQNGRLKDVITVQQEAPPSQ